MPTPHCPKCGSRLLFDELTLSWWCPPCHRHYDTTKDEDFNELLDEVYESDPF